MCFKDLYVKSVPLNLMFTGHSFRPSGNLILSHSYFIRGGLLSNYITENLLNEMKLTELSKNILDNAWLYTYSCYTQNANSVREWYHILKVLCKIGADWNISFYRTMSIFLLLMLRLLFSPAHCGKFHITYLLLVIAYWCLY